jgi:hypothetical protein
MTENETNTSDGRIIPFGACLNHEVKGQTPLFRIIQFLLVEATNKSAGGAAANPGEHSKCNRRTLKPSDDHRTERHSPQF